MKWILIANTNECQVYDDTLHQLNKLESQKHTPAKLKNSELMADKQGRYRSQGFMKGNFETRSEPKKIEAEKFAREMANELNAKSDQFDQLILVVPEQTDGLISKYLNKEVKEKITSILHKNVMNLPEDQLKNYLRHHS